MKLRIRYVMYLILVASPFLSSGQPWAAEKKGEYLLMGDVKEGWKVFNQKKCSQCHSIWGEGGQGGPDLGTLPEAYVSQSQLAALMWNHAPDMWSRMSTLKIPAVTMERKEMADLFAFLYFIRYMDEPGNPQAGKRVIETKACNKCHTLKEGTRTDLSRWGMYVNPILWAQMMWNHAPQMEGEMKKKGIARVDFQGNEMVDLIAYIRSLSPKAERVYLSPGDPETGERLFLRKGCLHRDGRRFDPK